MIGNKNSLLKQKATTAVSKKGTAEKKYKATEDTDERNNPPIAESVSSGVCSARDLPAMNAAKTVNT